MKNKRFAGIMPALVTPFDDAGALKGATVRRLIDWQLAQGVRGFYINGGTGEGPVLSAPLRKAMAEAAVARARGRGVVINHVGAPDVREAIDLARHAQACGCDAISSVVPNFFFTYDDDEIIAYYRALAEACELPLIVYATGLLKTQGVPAFMDRVLREVPTAIGVKYTLPNYYHMHQIAELNGGDVNVINGPDEMLLCGLAMGADGGIGSTYNLMAGWYVDLFDRFQAGDFPGAQRMQFRINRVVAVLIEYGVIRAIKQTLNDLGFDAGAAAPPGRPFDAQEARALAQALREAGWAPAPA